MSIPGADSPLEQGRCVKCGYDTTSLMLGDACPECGTIIKSPFMSTKADAEVYRRARNARYTALAGGATLLFCLGPAAFILAIVSLCISSSAYDIGTRYPVSRKTAKTARSSRDLGWLILTLSVLVMTVNLFVAYPLLVSLV